MLVPPAPGVFSAVGLLEAELEQHLVKTANLLLATTTERDIEAAFDELAAEAAALMRGLAPPVIARAVDARYVGQSFELTVPLPSPGTPVTEIAEMFAREHERTYGHRADDDAVQLVNLRVVARVPRASPPSIPSDDRNGAREADTKARLAYFGRQYGSVETPVLSRFDLTLKCRQGPLLIDEYDATTLVPPGCSARLDELNNILIRTEA